MRNWVEDQTSAELLLRAQRRAQITQSEWAHRSGVSQPLISGYLRGKTQPTYAQVTRLLKAAGLEAEQQLFRAGPRTSKALGDELVLVLGLVDVLPRKDRGELTALPFLKMLRHD